MDRVRDGRDKMQNDGHEPPEPVLRFDVLYGVWKPGPHGRPIRVESGPRHPLTFERDAFVLHYPMPRRVQEMIDDGVLRTDSVPEHPNYRYTQERTGESTV